MSYLETESTSHTSARREEIQAKLKDQREVQQEFCSPVADVFEKTSALITALTRLGCTSQSALDLELDQDKVDWDAESGKLRRGYPRAPNCCSGKIIFGYNFDQVPHVR